MKQASRPTEYIGLKLTDSQYSTINEMDKYDCFFNILCCARQWGKSTLIGQLILRDAINNPNSRLLYAAPIYAQARKMFNDIWNGISNSGVVSSKHRTELNIKLKNNSEIKFVGVENYDALRGLAINYMYLDEFQFMKPGAWDNALRPMLTVAGKKVYIVSTPRQQGSQFHILYLKGLENNVNRSNGIAVNPEDESSRYFSIHKSYLDNPMANLLEVEDARQNLPALIFQAEYEGLFIPSGGEVFAGLDRAASIKAFRMPHPGERIYGGLDLAKQHDYSVLTIINDKGEVLFIYRDQKKDWSSIVYNINNYLKQYGVKKCLVESNSIGDVVIDLLIKGGGKGIIEPFTTTPQSKPELIEQLIVAFESGSVHIPSKEVFLPMYNELCTYTYVYNPKTRTVKYGSPAGGFDDCVMSLAFAIECLKKHRVVGHTSFHSIATGSAGLDNSDNIYNF